MRKMAKAFYVSSTAPHSGKTALCIGLLLKFKKEGMNVRYMKPIGEVRHSENDMDKDVITIAKILELEPQKIYSPVLVHLDMFFEEIELQTPEVLLNTIKDAYQAVAAEADVVIIEGNQALHYLHSYSLDDVSLAKELDASIILVDVAKEDCIIDDFLLNIHFIQQHDARFSGVILNNTPRDMVERAKSLYTEKLEESNINVLGVITAVSALLAPTVGEILETLEGDLLEPGKEGAMDRLVESFVVGAMSLASALQYIRQAPPNSAIITGGDRADIALVALEQDFSALIFSGTIAPGVQILAKAKEKGVPVILSRKDTFSTTHLIEKTTVGIQPKEQEFCLKMIEDNIAWQQLLE
jgi:hypothetical protein